MLGDIEDEGGEPTGAALLDARDAKGFKGFCRAPFGWPDELIRLVLAACFRAGAIYLEHQTGAGPVRLYDFSGNDACFGKINTFKKVTLRVAETSLSIEQIKEASKTLIGLGVNGVPESGNALADTIRKLGAALDARLDEAMLRSQQGLPIPDEVLDAKATLGTSTTATDPTECVTSFLESAARWKALDEGLKSLSIFIDNNRHQDYELSRKLDELATNHPLRESHPRTDALDEARKNMAAIRATKDVIGRWSDYRSAIEKAFESYREAYIEAYEEVRLEVERTVDLITKSAAYANAPAAERDAVVDGIFGPGRICHYAPLGISSVSGLLDAADRRSLSSLAQALVALPGYRNNVETELRNLAAPSPPDEQVYEWRSSHLTGHRFKTEPEVDKVLEVIGEELKTRIREGFTVVVT